MPSGVSGTDRRDACSTGPTNQHTANIRKDLPKQNFISMGQGVNIKTGDLQTVKQGYLSALGKAVVMEIIPVWRKRLPLNVWCESVVLGQCAGLCSGLQQ